MEYQQVNTYNANRPHGFGRLDPETFTPYPKNPVIGAFFREIDRADELGSGMRNMMKYGRKYGGGDPQLIEGDIFRMIISVPEFRAKADLTDEAHDTPEVTTEVAPEVTTEVMNMLKVLKRDMTRNEIMAALGLKNEKHFRQHYQQAGIAAGLIEMTIPHKPKSSKQKYRITARGRKLLENTK
jgi:ATP-dependent DNA helicase RecG